MQVLRKQKRDVLKGLAGLALVACREPDEASDVLQVPCDFGVGIGN